MTKYRLTVMLFQVVLQFIPVLLSAIRHKPLWFLLYRAITTYRPGLFKHRDLLCCVSVRRLLTFANIVAYYIDSVLMAACTLVYTGGRILSWYRWAVYQYTVSWDTSGRALVLPGITGRIAQFTSQATALIDARLAPFTIHNNSHSRVTLTSLSRRIALHSVSIFMQSSSFTSLPRTSTSS